MGSVVCPLHRVRLAFPDARASCGSFRFISDHLANLLRVVSLVIIQFNRPQSLKFNHDYTWTVLVYGFIFWLWYLWATRFSQTTREGGAQSAAA